MPEQIHDKSKDSRNSLKRSLREIRLANQVNKLQRELNHAMKVLEDTEKERDGVAMQLDCALHHLDEVVNFVESSHKSAKDIMQEFTPDLPALVPSARQFLDAQFGQDEKVG